MCVRTLISNEVQNDVAKTVNSSPSKFTKAKEKYIKIHDDLINREMEIVSEKIITTLDNNNEEDEITTDVLSKSTTIFKKIIDGIAVQCNTWKDSNTYKILFTTTQPAHVIVVAALLCVLSTLVPTSDRIQSAGHPRSVMMSLIYLTSFTLHFGAQIWMTFVSGLSLYFALPRHTFGEVQRVLFPRYFTINACLSLTTLLIFTKHHPIQTWNQEITVQIIGMTCAFLLELLARLYLTPPLLQLIVQKTMIERASGVGSEIGKHNLGALKHCPHYMKIHGAFRKIHMSIAMSNIATMVCTVLHLHYIASKLCVL